MTQGAATRASAWSQWLWLGSALTVIMLGLFVGPRVPDERQAEFCVVNVHLAGPFGISLNCDSPDFMRLAREPAGLLEPRDARQSRPGLIAAAAVLALPLKPLADLAERAGAHAARADIDPSRVANSLAKDFPGYVAYVGLNVAFLLMSFALFRRICAPTVADSTAITVSIGVLLVANDVVKAFVWSPHNQMFNILVPVFALYGCMRAAEGTLASRRFALLTGLATGLGVTAYPLFFIIVPCILAGWLVDIVRHRRMPWGSAMGSAINLALLAALAVLPEGLWYLFVRLKTGAFYQHEMALGQVTWMLDSAQGGLGALVSAWSRNFVGLLDLAAGQAIPLAALLAVLAVAGMANPRKAFAAVRRQAPLIAFSVLIAVVVLAFYASVGLIIPRLALACLPPLLVATGAVALDVSTGLEGARRQALGLACLAIAIGQSVFMIVKDGPYS
jgi:hypothetical protein